MEAFWFPTESHFRSTLSSHKFHLSSLPSNPLSHFNQPRIKLPESKRLPSISSRITTPSPRNRLSYKHNPASKSKKFSEKDAFPGRIPIQNRNPKFIYRDIQNFADQNKLKEALTILDYLDHSGVPVNSTTFSHLIAACVRLKALKEGKVVHAHVRNNGLLNNEFLQTKLVHMYSACGSIGDAKLVFDEMPVKSVYPWNALLRGNVMLGGRKYREVLRTFSEMRELGVELNVYSFSCLIKSFAGASALHQGVKTHGLLIKNGLMNSNMLKTSLIDLYFKCGKIKLALRVFEEVEERDVVVWGAMIAGFAHNRLHREALDYVRFMRSEGVGVNSVILTSILPIIGEIGSRRLGQEIHAYSIKTKGYSKQLFVKSGLIDMYCKCGDMISGRKVFYSSKERNAVSWTALISGYVSNGRLDQALRSIIWMQQEGFRPDVVTIATVLPVIGELRALKQGKEIHGFAVKNGFWLDVTIATSLMMMYSKTGLLRYSYRLFNNLQNKNVISWTAMIDSCIRCESMHEALQVFRSMQGSKHMPDSVTTARMLKVCSELGALKLGKEIHGQVLKRDFYSSPFVSSELVKMYGCCEAIDKAKLSFEAIPVKGSMTWTAIIVAYKRNGQYQEAIDLFKQMISRGFSPNQYTFQVILCICEKAGFADDACKFFALMTQKYKIQASEENYCSIIRLLSSTGCVKAAEKYTKLKASLSP
ncbi:OLC1v1024000C2 [Oldenlandia corymbosa var. corymbosa]|nr:OLC1v1024000C2 [Oldenlandia corymbosa var. corymbosa]